MPESLTRGEFDSRMDTQDQKIDRVLNLMETHALETARLNVANEHRLTVLEQHKERSDTRTGTIASIVSALVAAIAGAIAGAIKW